MIRRRSPAVPLIPVLSVILFVACGSREGPLPPDLMERDTFVDVYVALRMQALTSPQAELPEEERARILAEYDVTVEDLVAFAEAHGRDPDYMLEVWREIEERLNVPVDSTADDSN